MGTWAYCMNEDCQHGFDKPSFAEIIARKRECPACGQINNVGDELGKALDEKFVEGVDPVRSADSKLADALREAIKIIDGALYCGHELNKEGESLLQVIRATYQDHHKES